MISLYRNTYWDSILICTPPKWTKTVILSKQSVITGKIRYIQVRMNLRIYYHPTYFRVAVRLQPIPCLNSYSFLPKMSSKSPCTEITSRNAKYVHIKCIISRLVGPFCMKFHICLRYSGLKLNLPLSPTFQNLPKTVVPPYQCNVH